MKTQVYWFGTREVSGVKMSDLKSLSEGLEEHHKERQKLRRLVNLVTQLYFQGLHSLFNTSLQRMI